MSAPSTTSSNAEMPTNPSKVETEVRTDASGQDSSHAAEAVGASGSSGASGTRVKSSAEDAADRLYEERIEEEYAKREGGA